MPIILKIKLFLGVFIYHVAIYTIKRLKGLILDIIIDFNNYLVDKSYFYIYNQKII